MNKLKAAFLCLQKGDVPGSFLNMRIVLFTSPKTRQKIGYENDSKVTLLSTKYIVLVKCFERLDCTRRIGPPFRPL